MYASRKMFLMVADKSALKKLLEVCFPEGHRCFGREPNTSKKTQNRNRQLFFDWATTSMTLKEIGKKYGISTSRCGQMIERTLSRFKWGYRQKHPDIETLSEALEDYYYQGLKF